MSNGPKRRVRWPWIIAMVTVIYIPGCRYLYSIIPPGLPLSNFKMFGITTMPLMTAWVYLAMIWGLDEAIRGLIKWANTRRAIQDDSDPPEHVPAPEADPPR